MSVRMSVCLLMNEKYMENCQAKDGKETLHGEWTTKGSPSAAFQSDACRYLSDTWHLCTCQGKQEAD